MMKLLVLDNYDSFTYNLVHIIKELGVHPDVIRNDKIELDAVDAYDKIVLSPGPGIPDEAGIMKALIKKYAESKSILGVCLGHQGIAEVFGAQLYNLFNVLHGVSSNIMITEDDFLFEGISKTFRGCHYHSWAVLPETIEGTPLRVTAKDEDGNIMAIAHRDLDIRGLQFHPESILTDQGKQIIENWINH